MNQERILIVDDDESIRRTLALVFEKEGYGTEIAATGQQAIEKAREQSFNVALLDIHLPDVQGTDLITPLKEMHPGLAAIMMTGYASLETAVRALRQGALAYINKPLNVQEVLAIVRDVSEKQRLIREKQQAERALRQHAIQLQERNEELDAFAHTVAHDLKHLLGLIIGYADVSKKDCFTMSRKELFTFLDVISQNGRKMNSILEALLLLAMMHKVDVEIKALDAMDIFSKAQERLAETIKECQAEITLPPKETWPLALGYGPWVEEVWFNYLSNALKHSGRPPRIELGFSTADLGSLAPPFGAKRKGVQTADRLSLDRESEIRNSQSAMACFWIRDNGDGVPLENQTRLFRPFTQLDQVNGKGHGLGLSIVKRIVERLGGQVGVRSDGVPGQGSVFTFTLPLAG